MRATALLIIAAEGGDACHGVANCSRRGTDRQQERRARLFSELPSTSYCLETRIVFYDCRFAIANCYRLEYTVKDCNEPLLAVVDCCVLLWAAIDCCRLV